MVLFDHLTAAEQQALQALAGDPDCYGILRSRTEPRLTVKAVSRDTALLLLTLQTPSLLPRYALAALGESFDSVIGRMILDGILEIESNGTMLSGPAARELVFDERNSAPPQRPIAALSQRAIEYAAQLETTDAAALSSRLYMYNRIPASTRWRRVLSDLAAVETYLGIRGDNVSRHLENSWSRLDSDSNTSGWIAWQSTRQTHAHAVPIVYKLYISPSCDEVRAAFPTVARTVAQSRAFHLKVGNDAYGILRPDKIVAYFRELADLETTATILLEKLDGCSPHGVPFTAEIGGDGLLSWGIDPPADERSVPWLARESWRSRICNRLATALVLAKTAGEAVSSITRFAMERLSFEGIDTKTWVPIDLREWQAAAGA